VYLSAEHPGDTRSEDATVLCLQYVVLHAAGYFTYLRNYFWEGSRVNDLWDARKVSSPRVRYYSGERGPGHKGKFQNTVCETGTMGGGGGGGQPACRQARAESWALESSRVKHWNSNCLSSRFFLRHYFFFFCTRHIITKENAQN
jgi:hypothetical protein